MTCVLYLHAGPQSNFHLSQCPHYRNFPFKILVLLSFFPILFLLLYCHRSGTATSIINAFLFSLSIIIKSGLKCSISLSQKSTISCMCCSLPAFEVGVRTICQYVLSCIFYTIPSGCFWLHCHLHFPWASFKYCIRSPCV